MPLRVLSAALALGLGLSSALIGAAPGIAATEGVPVRLAIAMPLVVPPGTSGLLDAETLALYTSVSPPGVLTRELDAVINRQVAIGIDPMIIASIRALGTAAPESAVGWLQRLQGASNQTFPLTYADSDITLMTQAGSPRVLDPQGFDFALDPSRFAPAADGDATPSPAPTVDPADPGQPPLPSTDDLLAWPYSLTGVAWPRENTLVGSDLRVMSSSGFTSAIVASSNVTRSVGAASTGDAAGTRLLISDDTVSAALRVAIGTENASDWAASLTALSASIATVGGAQAGDQATVLATLDRSLPLSGGRLSATLDVLEASGSVTLVPLTQVVGDEASDMSIADQKQPAARVETTSAALDAANAEATFATVAKDPAAITSKRRLELLALLSNSWASNPSAWARVTDDFLAASKDMLHSVQVVTSGSFNLLADRAGLPIAVSNKLDQPVTVYITVRPDTALLAVEDVNVKLVVEPNSQATGKVPVQALSNGVVRVAVTLVSGSGVPIGTPTSAEVNVQAGWETPIVVVIAILVVAVFGVGIVRNILRRRKPTDD